MKLRILIPFDILKKMIVNLYELLKSISLAMDFISPKLVNHHIQVTVISHFLGKEIGLQEQELKRLLMASLIHDIGGFSMKERIDTLNFDISNWNRHDLIGGKILKDCEVFSDIATLIEYHHKDYSERKRINIKETDFLLSQIINVADRFAILTKKMNIDRAFKTMFLYSGKKFSPDVVSILRRLIEKDIFKFEIKYQGVRFFEEEIKKHEKKLGEKDLISLFRLFSKIIDFKSPFTCAHSSGIADIAVALGKEIDLRNDEIDALKCAGLVHDIGKIGIPSELINKRGRLTANQYAKMKTHIYYSCKILRTIRSFDKIYDYAVHHHERLDGSGYPFGYKKDSLSTGARIMAVSDVYMALREDRPYRKGLEKKEVRKIMNKLVRTKKLCGDIVNILFKNQIFDEIIEKNKRFSKNNFCNIMI